MLRFSFDFFFLSQHFCLEKCRFDETEIAPGNLTDFDNSAWKGAGEECLESAGLLVMTFSEWEGGLICFFFLFKMMFQNVLFHGKKRAEYECNA